MKNDDQSDDFFDVKDSCVQYSITLAPFLQKKLDSHLQTLKFLHHPEKVRQTWILNAINEKILREKDSKAVSKEKYLGITLKKGTLKKLESKLAEISKMLPGYSKKQWVLEAIEEKLDEEKEAVQAKLAAHRTGSKSKS